MAVLALCASSALGQAATGDVATLQPVTITANKREQSLDSINGSVQVVDRVALDDAQVAGTMELSRVLPDVQMQQSGSLLFPVITVRGVTSAQDFYNPALTIYVDGVPQLPVNFSQTLLDVDRVELLKGPQGTLYGKSAEGGILNIVTQQPDGTVRGRVRGGLSSRGGYRTEGEISGPLVDGLLYGSMSLSRVNAPGDLSNAATGASDQGGSRSTSGQARLRLAPSGAPWEATLALGRECVDASQDAYVPFAEPSTRTAYVMPGMPAAFADFRQQRCGNNQSLSALRDWDDWRLTAVVAHQTAGIERSFPIGPYYSQQPEHWRQNVQELRLATNAPGRRWDAVFGLYRQEVDQSRRYINDLKVPLVANALDTQSENHTESRAIYGDVTWHLSSTVDVGGGLRFSQDKARTKFDGSALDFSTFTPQAFSGSGETDGRHTLGRLTAGWQFAPAWRAFANLSQGYKPGGFNLAPSSPAAAQAFGKERSTSVELGVRYTAKDLRASAAAYRIDVKDAQLYSTDSVGYQILRNAGDTRSTGLEAQAEWDVSKAWTVGLSGFVNDASFRRFVDAGCPTCSGNDVPFTPNHGLAATVRAKLPTALGLLRPQLSIRRVGRQYFDVANTLEQQSYTVVDAAVAWRVRPNLEVSFYAVNLTDRAYRTYAFAGGALGNYAQVATGRTIGASATWDF